MNDSPGHLPPPYSINNSLFRFQTIRRVLLLLAIFHFFLLMCYSLPKRFIRTDRNRDVIVYYLVSERIHKGEPVYWPLPEVGPLKLSAPFTSIRPCFAASSRSRLLCHSWNSHRSGQFFCILCFGSTLLVSHGWLWVGQLCRGYW